MTFWALYLWAGVCLFWKIYDDHQDELEDVEKESQGWGSYLGLGALCLLLWWAYPIPAIARWAWSKKNG